MSVSFSKFWPHNSVVAASGITPNPIEKSVTIVGAKTVDTVVSIIERQTAFSYILPFTTADAVGAFTIWAYNDWDTDRHTGNPVDVTTLFTAPAAVGGASGSQLFVTQDDFPFQAVFVRYVQASGTLVLKSSFAAKGR